VEGLAAVDLGVVGLRRGAYFVKAHGIIALQRIHFRHQFGQVAAADYVFVAMRQFFVQPFVAEQQVAQEGELLLVANRGIVFGAGYGQFLDGDGLVHQLPGVLALGGADLGHQIARVEAGDQWHRPDAPAAPVQPQRRARRHDGKAVVRLAWPRVMNSGGVVPHLVEVGQAAAGRADGVMQAAVGIAMRAVQYRRWRRAPVVVPVLAHALDVAVEAASGDDHTAGREFEGLAVLLADAAAAGNPAVGADEFIDALAEADLQVRPARMAIQRGDQAQRQFAPGAPDDVEARHRVAGGEQTTLDPVRRGQEADPAGAQPEPDVIVAALGVGLGPGIGPAVGRIEFAEGAPVGERQIRGIADAGAALLGGADEEDAAEAFLCQSAEVFRLVAVEQQDAAIGLKEFQCGAYSGDAAADDNDLAHFAFPFRCALRPPASKRSRAPPAFRGV